MERFVGGELRRIGGYVWKGRSSEERIVIVIFMEFLVCIGIVIIRFGLFNFYSEFRWFYVCCVEVN